MIITNIADGQVTSNDLVEFNFRDIAYQVAAGTKSLSGQVAASSYSSVDVQSALGSGPYQVTLGYVNQSYQAAPVTVDSADALVMFWMAFPAGPNSPKTFVFEEQS
jgi:hypothetical protein